MGRHTDKHIRTIAQLKQPIWPKWFWFWILILIRCKKILFMSSQWFNTKFQPLTSRAALQHPPRFAHTSAHRAEGWIAVGKAVGENSSMWIICFAGVCFASPTVRLNLWRAELFHIHSSLLMSKELCNGLMNLPPYAIGRWSRKSWKNARLMSGKDQDMWVRTFKTLITIINSYFKWQALIKTNETT